VPVGLLGRDRWRPRPVIPPLRTNASNDHPVAAVLHCTKIGNIDNQERKMSGSAVLESEITQWLVDLIEGEQLLEAIEEQEDIRVAFDAIEKRIGIPSFGFDHLSRRANVRAAATVLENLGLLEIVAVDKSISLTTGEVLRPDILCFNPESKTLVVFEVKRDKLTERQAITELAGYEQELRNALPFLGNFDVNFVVVAAHWDVLLDHAVGNFNTWSGKTCLALKVQADHLPFSLACHLPDVWQLRGGTGLPNDALQTIDVYLEENEDAQDDGSIANELTTAVNIIARSGDRNGSHGFVMLWRDHADFTRGHWCLTLCAIDPIAMHAWCQENGLQTRSSQLTQYLDKHVQDVPFHAPISLYKIARESFPVLERKYDPTIESLTAWDGKVAQLRRRACPVHFEFWGALGDYARDFICHEDVRTRYLPYIDRNGLDWTDPEVALPLLGNICDDIPFPDGTVRCSGAFDAGVRLGLHELLCSIADASEDEARKLDSLLRWSQLEALRVAIEMAEIYRTATEVQAPPPLLSAAPEKRSASITKLCAWVEEHLIGSDHQVHRRCFELGRFGAAFFSDWLDELERQEFLGAHADALASYLRWILTFVLTELRPFDIDPRSTDTLRTFLHAIGIGPDDPLPVQTSGVVSIPAADLLSAFCDDRATGLDDVIPAVLHTVQGVPPMALDWEGVKESVRKVFESGCRWPAVFLTQNGAHGVGKVDEHLRTFLTPIEDPDQQVYFLNQKSFASMWVKMSWTELRATLTSQGARDDGGTPGS
jgi:hypothetical protein